MKNFARDAMGAGRFYAVHIGRRRFADSGGRMRA